MFSNSNKNALRTRWTVQTTKANVVETDHNLSMNEISSCQTLVSLFNGFNSQEYVEFNVGLAIAESIIDAMLLSKARSGGIRPPRKNTELMFLKLTTNSLDRTNESIL